MTSYKPTIVLLGTNGTVGPYVLDTLISDPFVSKIALPVRAITRDAEKTRSLVSGVTEKNVKFYSADLTNTEELRQVFEGADVVINTLGVGSLNHDVIADAAAAAKVKLYIPSEFGTDIEKAGPYKGLFTVKLKYLEHAKELGLKTSIIVTGAFSELILSRSNFGGINSPEEGKFQYFGDIDTKISATSLIDIGKVVAAVVTKEPSEVPEFVSVSGADISPRILKETYTKVTGKELTDVALPLEDATGPALKVVEEGVKSPQDFGVGLRGAIYEGYIFNSQKDNESISKGLFEFVPFEDIAKKIYK